MIEWLKIILILSSLVGLLGVVRRVGAHYHWPPEWQRKTLHVALGLTALSFPWLFVATWPVRIICGAGALILLSLRTLPYLRRRWGRTLHDVNRDSTGELLFAAAIAILFELAHTTAITYVVPLAILTFADTAAALTGTAWGRHPFVIPFGRKSWEGVVAFGGTAFGIAILLLAWLTPLPWPMLVLGATTVALLTTLVEAIAWHGHDNLLVPLTGYLTLALTLDSSGNLLFYQLLVLGGVGLLLLPLWQELPTHTALTGLLALAVLWLGGPLLWLIPLMTLLFAHRFAQQAYANTDFHRLDAIPAHYWLFAIG